MKNHFKPHIEKMNRYQTSLGRNLREGVRLDRNERVSNFPPEIMMDFLKAFPAYALNASPEPTVLYEKISHSIDIPREQIFITNGITEGIRILFEILTNPSENLIVLDPTYPMYSIYAQMYQVEYRPFKFTENLIPDLESLKKGLDQKTAMVMIPNPNLPIESVFTVEEIRKIATLCKKNGTILVVDEAYHFFGAPTVLELLKEFDNLVVMRTFSKAYGMAGIRLGFMVSQVQNIQYLSKTRSLVESNTLSMGAAEYMLDHPEILQTHVKEVSQGAKYVQKELTSLGLRWFGGHVTNGILIFLNSEEESTELISYMKQNNVYIRGSFQAPYQTCVRVSIGPQAVMEIFIQTLKDWLQQRSKKNISHGNHPSLSRQ